MNKKIYQLMSVFVALILVLGSSYSAGALSTVGALMPQSLVTALPAFPGAEGFGANSVGGRGGKIYEVTNLNDAGAGSLRACVEASEARTCVFRTGGLIVLQSALRIVNPYITIAGQTAPGGGITLKKASGGDVFSTQTHDVIIRYIAVRPGPGGENHANQIAKNGVEIYNIIIDHNSLSWGVDSNIETWYRVTNSTIQSSLISEGLNCSTHSKGCHSKGIMIGGYKGSESGGKGSENISILNNLMAHNLDRNPLVQICGIGQVINNVVYNAGTTFSHQKLNCPLGVSYVNWVNNYYKKGLRGIQTDFKIVPSDEGVCEVGKAYLSGNSGNNGAWTQSFSGSCAGRTDILVTVPAPAPMVNSTSAINAYNTALASVGNSSGISCDGNWYSRRDAIDNRIINDVKSGTGNIIDDPSQVGGWIVPAAGVPCIDSDQDGMPDTWEQGYGFNPNSPDSSADIDGDGYTNIEEYFNGTNPLDSILVPSATPTLIPATTNTPILMPTSTLPMATITTSPVPVSATATTDPTATPTNTATITSATPTLLPATPTTLSAGQNIVEVRVIKGMDDVEENSSGKMYTNSSDLELVYDNSSQVIGMRFIGVKVPAQATITNAYLQFKVDETSSQTINLTINGEASANASAFTTTARNVSNRTRTSNNVTWSPASWATVGEMGTSQRTPNLKPIVQEIVNQSNWNSGNSLAIIITGNTGKRVAKSFESGAAGAPLLHIEFSTPVQAAVMSSSTTITATPTATLMKTFASPTTIPATFTSVSTQIPLSPTTATTATEIVIPTNTPIPTLVLPSQTVEGVVPTETPTPLTQF